MKNFTQIFSFLFIGLLMANCSGDDKSNAPTVVPALIVTTSAENVNGLDVTLNGKVTQGTLPIQNFGFCVSTDINPDINDNTYNATGSTGDYSVTVTSRIPNTTFHVRAFVTTNGGVFYGQDIIYTSSFPITSVLPTNILPKSIQFRGNVLSLPDNGIQIGYCYNTLANPTVSNQSFGLSGVGQFAVNIANLQPNTNYYARPYCEIDGQYYYGAEVNFKTTGYFGPAGGYVVYDKGDDLDGWRFLEIYPQTLNYDINFTTGVSWGCNANFLSNTYPELGKGLSNTQQIVANCNAANCAARLCDNYIRNGYSDWFLGSRDEVVTASNSLRSIGVSLGDSWTSTELVNVYANYVSFENSVSGYRYYQQSKATYLAVFPMRRY